MRRAWLAVLLALPVFAVPALVTRMADEQAERIGAGLAKASRALSSGESRRTRDREMVTDWRAQLADLWDELAAAPASAVSSSPAKVVGKPRGHRGIHVGAKTVLSLAERGTRPSGIFVQAEGKRPAGLMLLGVSSLGVGLRDGDILTHAAGQRATSEGQVVSLVLSARGARQAQIGGRIWRDGVSFPLVVDQPYLSVSQEKAPAANRDPEPRSDGTG